MKRLYFARKTVETLILDIFQLKHLKTKEKFGGSSNILEEKNGLLIC